MPRRRYHQYTIRHVPPEVDGALRRAARESGKSLNEVAVAALARGAGATLAPVRYRDLDWMAGTWVEDPVFDEVLQAQDTVDPEPWR